ncbi:fasciclin domain-containing protein [Komarekiella sp. 'clone 1']|uniref:Fasciclin domain-containing protein n=1 Tax=Komarekiella delphini-convector SJRDD-AB1 TaxID=2593771 RepID=A0AA40T2I8_9NOST|nr:fasciclin domain-containing protein [Komarekiella delphini-convector SJRDD-AB1]
MVKLKSATTVEGTEVKIDASKGVKVNDATVATPDVAADNGVIHIIDTVLIPA